MIYLLCSTIRPEVFKETHRAWMNACDNPLNVRTKIVVDSSLDYDKLANYDTMVYNGRSGGITKPLTFLTASLKHSNLSDDDIIIVMSDDFFPPEHWDTFLLEQFNQFNGCLNVYDGGSEAVQKTLITIPIMTYKCLKTLNYIIYNPAYKHVFSDNELFDIVNELKLMKVVDKAPEHTFEHRHWIGKKRGKDQHDEFVQQHYGGDRKTYAIRKSLPISEKLKCNMDNKLLSILILSMESRKDSLNRLLRILSPQLTDNIEILINIDDGKKTIGLKRQELLEKSKGKYVCYVDDDDVVSDDYVKILSAACKRNPDCIGIRGLYYENGIPRGEFINSINNSKWEDKSKLFLRTPNHLNPIKYEIAIKEGFNIDKSFGEDHEYSTGVKNMIHSEVYVPDVLYKYFYNRRK